MKNQRITPEHAAEAIRRIQLAHEEMRANRPSSMYVMGRQDWPEEDRYQLQFHKSQHVVRALFLGNGAGKAGRFDDPVLTPTGWSRYCDLSIGDFVIGVNGKKTRVDGVYRRGVIPFYRVHFNDGTHCDVGEDHLWTVKMRNGRFLRPGREGSYGMWETLETREIIKRVGLNPRTVNKPEIPMCDPVEFPASNVPIHPYVLGVILGDGCVVDGACRIHKPDIELFKRCGEFSEVGEWIDDGRCPRFSIHGVQPALRDLGLSGKRSWEKFIPESYLWNSADVRASILRGLMDTDGSARGGDVEFTSTSEKLANQVAFIVKSLGGKAVISDRITKYTSDGKLLDGRRSWRVRIKMKFCPFHLSRKALQWREGGVTLNRLMVRFERIEPAEAICIKVSADDGLYLVNDFIVTHNTTVVGMEADYWIQHSHPFQEIPKWPIQVLWVCQSFPQMGELRKQLEQNCLTKGHKWNETKHQYAWPNGGTLTIFSNDSDWESIQGIPIDLCVIDEECDPKHWLELSMRRRGKKMTRYVIAATATKGRRWMYHEIYIPWLERHGEAGYTEDQAMKVQLHPTTWCWPKGGLEDNPLSQTNRDGVAWYEASLARCSPQERKVRLNGGFASFNSAPVFYLPAVEQQQEMAEKITGEVGRLFPKSDSDKPIAMNGRMIQLDNGAQAFNPYKAIYEFFPDGQPTMGGTVTIFEKPEEGDNYSIGADFGAGLANRDWDVAVVISQRKKRQVATARGRWGDVNFAYVLWSLGWYYNEALIVGERQFGLPTLRRLYDEWGYIRIYMGVQDEADRVLRKSDMLGHHRFHGDNIIPRLEWALAPLVMDASGRPTPNRGPSVIQFVDKMLLQELHDYEWKPRAKKMDMADASMENLSMGAPAGKFDDMVMGAAYAVTGYLELPKYLPAVDFIKKGSMAEKLDHAKVKNEVVQEKREARRRWKLKRFSSRGKG